MTPAVGQRVFALLMADAAVVALVATRIYPGRAAQNPVPPFAVYAVVDELPQNSLQGYTSKLTRARVQVDAYAKAYLDAQALATAICNVLSSQTGGALSSVQLSRRDLYEDANELHRVSCDFSTWVKET